MPDVALRSMPDDLHTELKAAAKRNHRSLNGEILARLLSSAEPSVASRTAARQALLERVRERIRERRTAIGEIDLSPETIRSLRSEGRW